MYIFIKVDPFQIHFKQLRYSVSLLRMKDGLIMIEIWAKLWVFLALIWLNF